MSWETLQRALREIHEKNASTLSFEQLYRASYKIVLRKQGDRLYDLVKEYEEQWFAGNVMPAIAKLITTNLINITLSGVASSTANERRLTGEVFLEGLKASWEDHINVMNMTTDILMYMDRIYCADNRKASIFTTAMGLFRDHILREPLPGTESTTIFDILNSVVLDMIEMERDGDVVNKTTIRSIIYMLEGLYETDNEEEMDKLYLTTFEPAFLKASQVFYEKECTTLLREADASSWLRQTSKRLLEETARCQTTISQSSAKKIAKVVEKELISAHLQDFLALEGTGIKAMIQHDRYDDVKSLYQLISRVDPSKEPLKDALQARVVEMGNEINQTIMATDFSAVSVSTEAGEAADPASLKKAPKVTAQAKTTLAAIKWVDEVLKLKDKFDIMWKNCLNSDLQLQTALNKSFATFIDNFQRSSEYVSLFIDDNLKRGIMGKTEAEVDDVLDKATTLLRFITDKDMFERYYKKHLARRLLHGKSQSADVEKQMISRMKQEVGNAFTAKLDGMFKDMSLSDELTLGYREYKRNLGDVDTKALELGITVLTTNCWPMESMGGAPTREDSAPQSCTWPTNISTLQESFKAYYLRERNGRKLTWLGYLGNADIRCAFPKTVGKEGTAGLQRREYDVTVTTYGMLILLLFNELAEGESLSFEEIQQRTNIPTADLIRNLHTLSVVPKAKVLNKSPISKDIKQGDSFSFNIAFYSKMRKIKAPVIAGQVNKVEGEDERRDTEERNDEHRGNIIDTVLVRIMKYVPSAIPNFFLS